MEQNNKSQELSSQDLFNLRDFIYMCLAKWKWFVASVILCLGVAVFYILKTEPTYTRNASILIKDDSKGKSISGDISGFSELGMVTSNSNVNNEIGLLKSPDLMREVIFRLNLTTRYQVPNKFHKKTVYGTELPVHVYFLGLCDNESARCDLELKDGGKYILSNFELKGEKTAGRIEACLNDTIDTPAGIMTVVPAEIPDVAPVTTYSMINVTHISVASAIAEYTSNLSVARTDDRSNIVTLTYKDVSTQRAEDILITHIAVYNENWIKDRNQMAVSTSMFINERLGMIENELGEVDNNISSYKSQHLLPDVQSSAQMYFSQSSEAQAAIRELNTQLYMARYIKGYLTENNNLQLIPANSDISGSNVSQQIDKYNQQLLERNDLVSKSSSKNPLVVQMDAALENMRSALLISIENEIVAINTQIKSLQSYVGEANSQIASNPEQAKYLLSVERQQKVKESLYLYLLQKREENELSQAFTAYNTRLISMPGGSLYPTAPNKMNILLIALVIGILIPLGIIFLMETTNTIVRGRKDLERLSIPIIGEIPLYGKSKNNIGRTLRRKLKKNSHSGHNEQDAKVVVKPGSRDIINEAFRVLRTNLEFMNDDSHKQNVSVVTSFNPGSGKSFLSMNIAVSLAIKNKDVLVIDGDLRHASSSAYVGFPKPGLSDYLGGKIDNLEDIIVSDGKHEHLKVLPVGTIPPNPTELLFSERLKQIIAKVRNQYDYIFIDCPPIEMVADTQIIEKIADRTIFIVRAGLFERSMLPELENIYTSRKYKNMSLILNCTEGVRGRYGYRYGYHYGYGSDYHYGNDEKK